MTRLVYFFKTAFRSMARNLVLNLVSVTTISLALLILAAFLLIQANLQHLVESSPAGLNISVYLQEGLPDPERDRLKDRISQIEGIEKLEYVSKDQALAELEKQLGDQGGLVSDLSENPLPSSFELKLTPQYRDESLVNMLSEKLAALKGVDEVHFAWDWAEKLNAFIRFIKVSGFVVGGLLFLAVVFIIANTIRLTVIARQDELYIMRLMGATEGFIRTPFIIEGMTQGMAGGLLALIGALILHAAFISRVQLPFGLAQVRLVFLSGGVSFFIICSGGILGLIGSQISLGRLKAR